MGMIINPYMFNMSAGLLLIDMVAHWDLSEASGTRYDSHTNGFDLSVSGPSVGQASGVGAGQYAASFSSGNWLIRAHNALLNPEDEWFVCNFWANRNPSYGNSHNAPFVGKGDSFYTDAGTGWMVLSATGVDPGIDYMGVRNSADTGYVQLNTAADSVRGQWYMFTFVHDPIADEIRYYRDGVLEDTQALSGGVYASTAQLALNGFPGSAVSLSDMQALSIWKGAGAETAEAQISWLYNSGTAARLYADLVAYGG